MSIKARSLFMWSLMCAFFFYQFVARVSPDVMAEDLQQYFNIEATQFGLLVGAFYAGYALMQIPSGVLLDLYGPRYIATALCLVCGAGVFLFSVAENWTTVLIGRFLVGVGAAGAFISTSKLIRMWFEEDKYSRIVGITVAVGLSGAMFGGVPLSYSVDLIGWKSTLLYLSMIGALISLSIFLFVKNPNGFKEDKEQGKIDFKATWEVMIENKILWIALFGALLSGPLYSFAGSWSKTYFGQVYGWGSQDAAAPGSIIYGGMVFGGPMIALLSERFHNYAKLIALSGLLMAAALFGIMYLKLPFAGVAIFLIIIGFFSAYQVLVFGMVTERTPQWLGGTMIGIVNMINMVSGIIYPIIFGNLLDAFWQGTMSGKVRFYGEYAFNMGIFSLIAGLLIGAAGFYFIKYEDKAKV
jgi:predicted MFS family arabinose efflux permease